MFFEGQMVIFYYFYFMVTKITFALSCVFLFSFSSLKAQTFRDSLISEITYNYSKNFDSYLKLKSDIKKLEEIEQKANPEILHNKLEIIYSNKDVDYFKDVLVLLTRNYGFNLSFASGYENYYTDILKGELSVWFKEMYIKNHSEWLNENFDKQVTIFKLNSFHKIDQKQRELFRLIYDLPLLEKKQMEQLRLIEGVVFKENFEELMDVATKLKSYPTGNSFALIQKPFEIVTTHILQHEVTFADAWQVLYPFYKMAYLKNNVSSIVFRNIDSYSYLHNGNQVFDLLKLSDIPEYFRKKSDDNQIPFLNSNQTKKMRIELGWK